MVHKDFLLSFAVVNVTLKRRKITLYLTYKYSNSEALAKSVSVTFTKEFSSKNLKNKINIKVSQFKLHTCTQGYWGQIPHVF